jgi:hypothetical protein
MRLARRVRVKTTPTAAGAGLAVVLPVAVRAVAALVVDRVAAAVLAAVIKTAALAATRGRTVLRALRAKDRPNNSLRMVGVTLVAPDG